jgi:hypothetical protein
MLQTLAPGCAAPLRSHRPTYRLIQGSVVCVAHGFEKVTCKLACHCHKSDAYVTPQCIADVIFFTCSNRHADHKLHQPVTSQSKHSPQHVKQCVSCSTMRTVHHTRKFTAMTRPRAETGGDVEVSEISTSAGWVDQHMLPHSEHCMLPHVIITHGQGTTGIVHSLAAPNAQPAPA